MLWVDISIFSTKVLFLVSITVIFSPRNGIPIWLRKRQIAALSLALAEKNAVTTLSNNKAD